MDINIQTSWTDNHIFTKPKFAIFSTATSSCYFTPVLTIIKEPVSHLFAICFCSSAYEWQGHSKPLHPVSMEVDEKRKLQVFDRSGSAHRCLNLGNQAYLDVLLSSDRQHKALLLKVSKEYDLVSRWKRRGRWWFAPWGSWSEKAAAVWFKLQENNVFLKMLLPLHFVFTFKIVLLFKRLSHLCTEVASALIFHPVVDASMILQMCPIYITFISVPILLIFSLCFPFAHPGAVFWWREQTCSICQPSAPGGDGHWAGD